MEYGTHCDKCNQIITYGEIHQCNVFLLPTRDKIPVKNVLKSASHLEMVVVMGYDEHGQEYFAYSDGSNAEVAWLAQRLIHFLTNCEEEDE